MRVLLAHKALWYISILISLYICPGIHNVSTAAFNPFFTDGRRRNSRITFRLEPTKLNPNQHKSHWTVGHLDPTSSHINDVMSNLRTSVKNYFRPGTIAGPLL